MLSPWWVKSDTEITIKLFSGNVFGVETTMIQVSKGSDFVTGSFYDFKQGTVLCKKTEDVGSFSAEEERMIDHDTFMRLTQLRSPFERLDCHLAF